METRHDTLPQQTLEFSWGVLTIQPSHKHGPIFDISTPFLAVDSVKAQSIVRVSSQRDREQCIALAHILISEDILGAHYITYLDYCTAHRHWSNLNKYVRPLTADAFAHLMLRDAIQSWYMLRKRGILLMKAHLANAVNSEGRGPREVAAIQQILLALFTKALHAACAQDRSELVAIVARRIYKLQ